MKDSNFILRNKYKIQKRSISLAVLFVAIWQTVFAYQTNLTVWPGNFYVVATEGEVKYGTHNSPTYVYPGQTGRFTFVIPPGVDIFNVSNSNVNTWTCYGSYKCLYGTSIENFATAEEYEIGPSASYTISFVRDGGGDSFPIAETTTGCSSTKGYFVMKNGGQYTWRMSNLTLTMRVKNTEVYNKWISDGMPSSPSACSGTTEPTPTPTGSPSPTPTDCDRDSFGNCRTIVTPTPTPTGTPSPTPTATPTPTPTDCDRDSFGNCRTIVTPTPTPTATPSPTPTPTPTDCDRDSFGNCKTTVTPTPTPTATPNPTPTATPTPTAPPIDECENRDSFGQCLDEEGCKLLLSSQQSGWTPIVEQFDRKMKRPTSNRSCSYDNIHLYWEDDAELDNGDDTAGNKKFVINLEQLKTFVNQAGDSDYHLSDEHTSKGYYFWSVCLSVDCTEKESKLFLYPDVDDKDMLLQALIQQDHIIYASLSEHGVIYIVSDTQALYAGVLDHRRSKITNGKSNELVRVGDLNGDGIDDYEIYYGNDYKQEMYYYNNPAVEIK